MAEHARRSGPAPRRIVIVGGSIAAVETATTLRQIGFDGDITMLSDEQHAPYLRVPLSKAVLAGTTAPESVTISGLGDDVALRLGARAVGLDLDGRLVHLVGPLLAAHLTSAARARGARIVVSPKDVALRVEHRRPEVWLDDGRRLTADLVVSAVGDIPNTEWLAGSQLALHGGLLVDSRCRAGADVFAAGDVTAMQGPGGIRRMPHWTNALEQARAAAATLLYGDDAPPYTPSPYYWTEQFGVSLRLCGRTPPLGTLRELEMHPDGSPALLSWSDNDDLTKTVAALNHRAPAGRLKRLLHTENAA